VQFFKEDIYRFSISGSVLPAGCRHVVYKYLSKWQVVKKTTVL